MNKNLLVDNKVANSEFATQFLDLRDEIAGRHVHAWTGNIKWLSQKVAPMD